MVRITFNFLDVLPAETLAAHREANKGRPGLRAARHASLAVVGGHPRIARHVETLRQWRGDVWAINGAWRWCNDRGIKASFVSCDPSEHVVGYCDGARHAILARHCNPRAFDGVYEAECFDLGADDVLSGPTTATAIPHLAVMTGHTQATFFGCGGDIDGTSHAYADAVPMPNRLAVETTSGRFITEPGLLVQSEWLAKIIRAAPNVFSERSGGLLSALIEDPSYDITAASRSIVDTLREAA